MFAKASSALFLAVATLSAAHAHQGGHGPLLEGLGPHGGKRAAVVSAADAGKGSAAPVQAVAEWKLTDGVLTVHFWDSDQKRPLTASGDLTWILLPNKDQAATSPKPVVLRRTLRSGRTRLRLSEGLHKAHAAEIVLGSLSGREGKQVVYLNW